jgi:hypothetical protein
MFQNHMISAHCRLARSWRMIAADMGVGSPLFIEPVAGERRSPLPKSAHPHSWIGIDIANLQR